MLKKKILAIVIVEKKSSEQCADLNEMPRSSCDPQHWSHRDRLQPEAFSQTDCVHPKIQN